MQNLENSKLKKKILLPEGNDSRIIEAGIKAAEDGICEIFILNSKTDVSRANLTCLNKINLDSYTEEYFRLRKGKESIGECRILLQDPMYLSVMMLYMGEFDGVVGGATMTTADTLRPALKILKTEKKASSFFIMKLKDKNLYFADCGLSIDPSYEELADIAIMTNDSIKKLGVQPKVAMLSFSTKGSANHPAILKVKKATDLVKSLRSDIIVDGEIQADSALAEEVAKSKCPESVIAGNANVLIFPDLNSGNIAYKLVERLAGAEAIGPIVQGLKKPVNDLSRGAKVSDIVEIIKITCHQADIE